MHRVDMHALEKGRDLSRGDDVITMTPCGGKTGMEEGSPSPPPPSRLHVRVCFRVWRTHL